MKFVIESIKSEPRFKDGAQIFPSGDSVIRQEKCERMAKKVGENKMRWATGLQESDIKLSPVLTSSEKELLLNKLPEYRSLITGKYGEGALDPENSIFWNNHRYLTIRNDNALAYDDQNPDHMLLKLGIMTGAFPVVAPNYEAAQQNNMRYYIIEESVLEDNEFEDEYGTKIDAISALKELDKKGGQDGLLYMTWVTCDMTKGYTKKTTRSTLQKTLMDFIEGKHTEHGKRKCPKLFLDNYNRWKLDKDDFIIEAMVKAGLHFGEIYSRNGKFYLVASQAEIGLDIAQVIKNLKDPKNAESMLLLREKVMDKLDEKNK